METINEKIKRLRIESGVSKAEMARAAGLKQSSYSSIENGETKSITIEVGKGIARALDISFNELFEIESLNGNTELIEKLTSENDKLKQDLQIQTSLFSAFEMIRDGEILNKNLLKHLQEKDSLIKSFQFIDNELFAKHNQQFIAQISLIETFDIECVEKFHNFYGRKAGKEIMKYVDIEKFKKSSTFEFLVSFWEGDGNWSKERIIEWAQEERKKLI